MIGSVLICERKSDFWTFLIVSNYAIACLLFFLNLLNLNNEFIEM